MSQHYISPSARTPAVWKIVAVFAVVGPFIGGLIGVLVMILFSDKVTSLADVGSMSFVTLIFGYVFGLLPAALTGLAVTWSRKRQPHQSTVRLGVMWGAILASLAGLHVVWLGGGGNALLTAGLFAIMGATAGSVCGWLVRVR
jgi:uncharacterized membrane protein